MGFRGYLEDGEDGGGVICWSSEVRTDVQRPKLVRNRCSVTGR
jgi:hypothetical protein